jgi:3-oxoacyl-(acyl-carrier-protein) synthase
MAARGLRPVGPAVEAVAISSDAEHIITPSAAGPLRAIRDALARAEATPDALAVWDLHATGTPGDLSEVAMTRPLLGPTTVLTARKGLFGHGMANAGGWELTALALALGEGRAAGTGIAPEAVHASLRALAGEAIVTSARPLAGSRGVKVTLGIGGVTACVVLGATSSDGKGCASPAARR